MSRSYTIAGRELSREAIVHKYLHLVKYVAGRISISLPPQVETNDLVSEGIIGLLDAIEKYDDGRGVKFETYAVARINGAILDSLRSLDWVPRGVRQRSRDLERGVAELEARLGRAATTSELASHLRMSAKELDVLRQRLAGTSVSSLEESVPADALRDPHDAESALESREVRELLERAVARLSAQERTVISMYYFRGLAIKEIKTALGVSESRVSQIHSKAIARLRDSLRPFRSEFV
jgi:RNA polymerase sigma factor FliA